MGDDDHSIKPVTPITPAENHLRQQPSADEEPAEAKKKSKTEKRPRKGTIVGPDGDTFEPSEPEDENRRKAREETEAYEEAGRSWRRRQNARKDGDPQKGNAR